MGHVETIANAESLLLAEERRARLEREASRIVAGHFEALGHKISRYVQSLGVAAGDVDDVLQEVFLALFRHVAGGGPRTHVRGWVFRVAHNLGMRQLRSEHRLRSKAVESRHLRANIAPRDPEEQLLDGLRQKQLLAVFAALPEKDRQCLALRLEGLRYREIGEALGISLGTVANSVARSLEKLERAEA